MCVVVCVEMRVVVCVAVYVAVYVAVCVAVIGVRNCYLRALLQEMQGEGD